ncbi:MAG: hypothetical protein JW951_07680 [Lentisphaerae bacterium]|nr:hypothetical protein [Lentisphaerota bacterium]
MKQREAIGLDIGTHAAKAVRIIRAAGGVRVGKHDWVRLPAREEERERVLRSFIEKHGWSGRPCVVPMRGEGLMLRTLLRTPGDERSVADIVASETEPFDSLSDRGTVRDCVTQPRFAGRRSVCLAVARLDGVLRAVEFHDRIGLRVVDVVPGAVALFNAMLHFGHGGRGLLACVDIGHRGTEICIGRARQIFFVRRLPVGADALPHEADRWLGELRKAMDLFGSQFPEPRYRLKRVLLCGGGALTETLPECVERATGVQTERLGERVRAGGIREIERYGTALGLGLAGLGKGRTHLSLLPRPIRENLVLKWQKKYWVLSGAALVLTCTVLTLGTWKEARRYEQALVERRAAFERQRQQRERLLEYEALNRRLEEQVTPLRIAVRNGALVRAVIAAAGTAKHEEDWITLIADARSYAGTSGEDPRAGTAAPSAEETQIAQIILEGYTPVEDLSTVRRMIEVLREHPAVADADLLGDDRVRTDAARDALWEGTGCRLFAVEVTPVAP